MASESRKRKKAQGVYWWAFSSACSDERQKSKRGKCGLKTFSGYKKWKLFITHPTINSYSLECKDILLQDFLIIFKLFLSQIKGVFWYMWWHTYEQMQVLFYVVDYIIVQQIIMFSSNLHGRGHFSNPVMLNLIM